VPLLRASAAVLALGVLAAAPAQAHFQELIPEPALVTDKSGPDVALSLTFTHPMENGPAMDMGKPARFGMVMNGATTDLTDRLEAATVDGKAAYRAKVTLDGPGDALFFVEPAPYWEPAEGVMIVHYTKVVVDAFAADEGWDAMVGFPVEIQPLTRPYGLYAGNLFSGVVTRDGAPVPFAEVEVEYRSEGAIAAPEDVFITQVLRADANGTFHYAMPRAGWWGFAALLEGPEPMTNPEGAQVPVEQGALLWVNAVAMPTPAR
jgi:cobalt/nickel transport protein